MLTAKERKESKSRGKGEKNKKGGDTDTGK